MGIVMVATVARRRPAPDLPQLGKIQDFSLTNQRGEPFRLSDLSGQVWIANFIFTSCGGQCPRMTSLMAKIQDSSPPAIALVSFSVDPEFDSPKILRQYAEKYGADTRWYFLTGPRRSIRALAEESFKLGVSDKGGTEAEPILHSSRFVLVDKNGQIRGYYDSENPQFPKNLIRDAESLCSS